MNRIIISTSKSKALDCQKEGEANFISLIESLIGDLEAQTIIKYNDSELYFLIDTYNDIDKIAFTFNFESDILLYHNISVISGREFVEKFSLQTFAIHNENSLYRKVFEVFVGSENDKYGQIFEVLKPTIEALNISKTTLFLKDICNTNISLTAIREKHPTFTDNPAFQDVITIFYKDNNNVFDCNNETHVDEYKQLREKLNISN